VADQGLRGDGVGVEHEGQEEPQLQRDLVGTQRGRAGAGDHRGGGGEGELQHRRPDEQVAAEQQVDTQRRGPGPPVDAQAAELPPEGQAEERRGHRLAHHVGHRGADQPEPRGVDEQRAQHQADQAAGQHEPDGSAEVLHPAEPAVAGEGEQQQREPGAGDPQPLLGGGGDRAGPAGEQPGERSGEQLEHPRQEDAETEGQPAGLHALGDRTGPVAGSRAAGGPRGGAVREEVQQRGDVGQQPAADRQPAQRDGAEVADDGGVDEQVERLGRQHDQRRRRERGDRRA
jgi:hypothetical protein